MKNKYLGTVLLLAVCTCLFSFRLADDPFEALLKKLATYNEVHPQEKVYLHLDRPYYAIGDNIWFKAYVTDNRTNAPSTISSTLYVELISEGDSLRQQIKLPLVNGITWGDFKLPDDLPEGNYRIRANTQWMRNAGPDFFYDKTIKIGSAAANDVYTSTSYTITRGKNIDHIDALIKFKNLHESPYQEQKVTYEVRLQDKLVSHGKGITNALGEVHLLFPAGQPGVPLSGMITAMLNLPGKQQVIKNIPIKVSSTPFSIQLFPESGNLVNNLPAKIGIKVINTSGLGEDVSGVVTDNDGIEVTHFTTTHVGMGSFMMNPDPGKTYTAKVKLKDGTTQEAALPKSLTEGYVLSITHNGSKKVSAKILISNSLLVKGDMKLVIQQNNTVYAVLRSKSDKQLSSVTLPQKDLPSGILHFTLFSPQNIPVAERMIFINNPADQIETDLPGLKPAYGRREKVSVDFSAKYAGGPARGSFSVAVTNTSTVMPDEDNESNILSTLLLTSDLKGYIEKPNYYFRSTDEKTTEDLDNLMLTQGWSRFLWKDLTGAVPAAFPAEKDLKISGTVTTPHGSPVVHGRVSLLSTAGGLFMLDSLTDNKGRFSFNNLDFGDTTEFFLQARNAKARKNVDIHLDVIPGQVITKNKNTGDIEVNVDETIKSYIRTNESYFDYQRKRGLLEHGISLNQVNIEKKKEIHSANWNGTGNADDVLTAKDLARFSNISDALRSRVHSITVSPPPRGVPRLIRNGRQPMQIILDGLMIDNDDILDYLPTTNIALVEVLEHHVSTAIYGPFNNGGLIIITSKRGYLTDAERYGKITPGVITFTPKGYSPMREFYSPKYTPGNKDQRQDQRQTVFWNPNVLTAADGTAQFSFYTTDLPGTYRIVLEGIDGDGHLARKVSTYEVK